MKHSISRVTGFAAAAVLAAGGLTIASAGAATAEVPATTTVSATSLPALSPGSLKYEWRALLVHPDYVTALQTPKGWRMVRQSKGHIKWLGGGGVWLLRAQDEPSWTLAQSTAVKAKLKALHGTPGLRVISTTTGKVKNTHSYGFGSYKHVTTLTYTYRDGARGTRYVMTRWVGPVEEGRTVDAVITVGGRVKDKAGLNAVLTKASQSIGTSD